MISAASNAMLFMAPQVPTLYRGNPPLGGTPTPVGEVAAVAPLGEAGVALLSQVEAAAAAEAAPAEAGNTP